MTAIAGGGIRTNRHSNQQSHSTALGGGQLLVSSGTGGTGQVSGVDARMARKGYGESTGAFERLGTIYDWLTVPASLGLADGVGTAQAQATVIAAADGDADATSTADAEGASTAIQVRTVVSWVELSGTAAEEEFASGAGDADGVGAAAGVGAALTVSAADGDADGTGAAAAEGAKTAAAAGGLVHQLGTVVDGGLLLTTTTTKLSQSFTVDAVSLVSVNAPTFKGGSPTGDVTAKIYAVDVSHFPTGSQIGGTATVAVSSLPADLFIFPSSIDLVAGTYAVVFEHSVPGVFPTRIELGGSVTSNYSGGQYSQLQSSVWTAYANVDLFGYLNFTSVGRASAVGASISEAAGVGDADGIGAATGVGAQTAAGQGAASGTSTAQATGAQTPAAVGSASGVGAALAAGNSPAIGFAAGTSTAQATAIWTAAAAGSAAGVGLQIGDSGGLAFGAGDADGVGAASATGAATSAAVGAASGIGAAAAVGAAEGGEEVIVPGVGNAAGVGEADGRSPRRISAGAGALFRFGPALIEGIGYGILPELEGYAVGTVGRRKTIAGRAKGIVGLTGHGVCDIGVKGAAYSVARLPLMASAPADVGSAGQAQVNLTIKGGGMGDHDPDEHVVIALMMAA